MNKCTNTNINNEVTYLIDNGFITDNDINDNFFAQYDFDFSDNGFTISDKEIKQLKDNIIKIYPHFGKIIDNFPDKYWLLHKIFITTYDTEYLYYNTYGIDSWIYYLNKFYYAKNYTSDEVYANLEYLGLTYFNVIRCQMSLKNEFNMLTLECMDRVSKINILKIIVKKKLKWVKDYEIIYNLFLESKDHSSDITFDVDASCICNIHFIKHHIRGQYMNIKDYDKSNDMEYIHNTLCPIHAAYLSKYQTEIEQFEKYNTDNWIQYFSELKLGFRDIMKTDPHSIGLTNYVYIKNHS